MWALQVLWKNTSGEDLLDKSQMATENGRKSGDAAKPLKQKVCGIEKVEVLDSPSKLFKISTFNHCKDKLS